ncbi:MAG: phospholipase D family protein [Armatimonadetes bacterium]|nr:phospholipase D family protein [Armatimonadota bacterium]
MDSESLFHAPDEGKIGFRLPRNEEIYEEVVVNGILLASRRIWIATANLKDLHIKRGRRYLPILEVFDALASSGVEIRLIHSGVPSRPFQESLRRCRNLLDGGMEMLVCPRVHFKMVVVDGKAAYSGSANFTGAGMGVKGKDKRNFELGFWTDLPPLVEELSRIFDRAWCGEECGRCRRRSFCPAPID